MAGERLTIVAMEGALWRGNLIDRALRVINGDENVNAHIGIAELIKFKRLNAALQGMPFTERDALARTVVNATIEQLNHAVIARLSDTNRAGHTTLGLSPAPEFLVMTAIEGIRQLQPIHFSRIGAAVLSRNSGELNPKSYYRPLNAIKEITRQMADVQLKRATQLFMQGTASIHLLDVANPENVTVINPGKALLEYAQIYEWEIIRTDA